VNFHLGFTNFTANLKGERHVRLATHAAQASDTHRIAVTRYLRLPGSLGSCRLCATAQRLCSPRSRLFGTPGRKRVQRCLSAIFQCFVLPLGQVRDSPGSPFLVRPAALDALCL